MHTDPRLTIYREQTSAIVPQKMQLKFIHHIHDKMVLYVIENIKIWQFFYFLTIPRFQVTAVYFREESQVKTVKRDKKDHKESEERKENKEINLQAPKAKKEWKECQGRKHLVPWWKVTKVMMGQREQKEIQVWMSTYNSGANV